MIKPKSIIIENIDEVTGKSDFVDSIAADEFLPLSEEEQAQVMQERYDNFMAIATTPPEEN